MRVPPAALPSAVEWTQMNISVPVSRSRCMETDSPSHSASKLSTRGWSLGRSLVFLGVLDHGQDARRDEPCSAHDTAGPRQLPDLDRRARAAHLDAAAGTGGFDHVFTRRTVACIHQNLDKISLRHTFLVFPDFASSTPPPGGFAADLPGERGGELMAQCRLHGPGGGAG